MIGLRNIPTPKMNVMMKPRSRRNTPKAASAVASEKEEIGENRHRQQQQQPLNVQQPRAPEAPMARTRPIAELEKSPARLSAARPSTGNTICLTRLPLFVITPTAREMPSLKLTRSPDRPAHMEGRRILNLAQTAFEYECKHPNIDQHVSRGASMAQAAPNTWPAYRSVSSRGHRRYQAAVLHRQAHSTSERNDIRDRFNSLKMNIGFHARSRVV